MVAKLNKNEIILRLKKGNNGKGSSWLDKRQQARRKNKELAINDTNLANQKWLELTQKIAEARFA